MFLPATRLFCSDMSGAAEPIRWALEQGGLEWTDKRLTREEFGALKPSELDKRTPDTLLGVVPVVRDFRRLLPSYYQTSRLTQHLAFRACSSGDVSCACRCEAAYDVVNPLAAPWWVDLVQFVFFGPSISRGKCSQFCQDYLRRA